MKRVIAFLALLAAGCSTGDETVAPASLPPDPRVQATIQSMTSRYEKLLADCDHKGLFALAYLKTTEEYLKAAEQPGYFQDPKYLNDEDTLFAKYYFDHVDDWTSGNVDKVPPAWKLSFQSSDDKAVSTLGDAILGISAHINQDLPYVIATLGVTDAQGRTRKPDHDKVNDFLAQVSFDDDIRASWDSTYNVDYATGLPTIYSWREAAWQSALALIAAKTPDEKAKVDADIASNAESTAKLLQAVSKYTAGDTSAARDAYCQSMIGH